METADSEQAATPTSPSPSAKPPAGQSSNKLLEWLEAQKQLMSEITSLKAPLSKPPQPMGAPAAAAPKAVEAPREAPPAGPEESAPAPQPEPTQEPTSQEAPAGPSPEEIARGEYWDQLAMWNQAGYVVDRLERIMDTASLTELAEEFALFEDDIQKLEACRETLEGLASEELAEDIERIRALLNDPDRIEEIITMLTSLEERITHSQPAAPAPAPSPPAPAPVPEPEPPQAASAPEPVSVKPPPPLQAPPVPKAPPQLEVWETHLIPSYTFDTFVVGSSNRFTHAAALAVAKAPAEAYNPLFIHGGSGLGKTHLMCAIGNYVVENFKNMRVLYVTTEKFTNELLDALQTGTIQEFRERYRGIDLLLVDDIQFLGGKESTQEEFFHTFNHLYNAHKQIVITSDKPPKNINLLEDRLRSRFEGGLITDMQLPDLETKIIILRRKAKKEGVHIPDEVMHFIATNIKSSIRELEGALNKVVAYSKLTGEMVDFNLAKMVLRDIIPAEEEAAAPAHPAPPPAPVQAPAPAPATPIVEEPAADEEPEEDSGLAFSLIQKKLADLKLKLGPSFGSSSDEVADGESMLGGEDISTEKEANGGGAADARRAELLAKKKALLEKKKLLAKRKRQVG